MSVHRSKSAHELLHEELDSRGLNYQVIQGDRYQFRISGISIERSIQHVLQQYKATGDPAHIVSFVDSLSLPDVSPEAATESPNSVDAMHTFSTFVLDDMRNDDFQSVIEIDASIPTPEPPQLTLKVTKAMLSRDGFLQDAMRIPLASDETRAVFIGMYGLTFFESLASFAEFTEYMSGATQDWYTSHNIDEALSNITPWDEWPTHRTGQKGKGPIAQFLMQRDVEIDMTRIPDLNAVAYEWSGSDTEFGLVARCDNCWLDLYVADRID